jgi:hypothetical protein
MTKNTKILLIVIVLVIGLAGLFMTKPKPTQKGMPVFSCELVNKQTVTVTAQGDQLNFTFGDVHITGSGKSGNVAYHHEMWPCGR